MAELTGLPVGSPPLDGAGRRLTHADQRLAQVDHATRRVTVRAGKSLYVARYLEVEAGGRVELEADADLEVG